MTLQNFNWIILFKWFRFLRFQMFYTRLIFHWECHVKFRCSCIIFIIICKCSSSVLHGLHFPSEYIISFILVSVFICTWKVCQVKYLHLRGKEMLSNFAQTMPVIGFGNDWTFYCVIRWRAYLFCYSIIRYTSLGWHLQIIYSPFWYVLRNPFPQADLYQSYHMCYLLTILSILRTIQTSLYWFQNKSQSCV